MKQQSSISEPPFGGLRGNVYDSSLACWKARTRLSIGYNQTFFASSYGSDVIRRYWSKSAFFKGQLVTLSANFSWKGTPPTNLCWYQKTFSCGIKISAVCSFISSKSMRVTDGRTDRQTELRSPRLRQHSCFARSKILSGITRVKVENKVKRFSSETRRISGTTCVESLHMHTMGEYCFHVHPAHCHFLLYFIDIIMISKPKNATFSTLFNDRLLRLDRMFHVFIVLFYFFSLKRQHRTKH